MNHDDAIRACIKALDDADVPTAGHMLAIDPNNPFAQQCIADGRLVFSGAWIGDMAIYNIRHG